MINFIMQNIYSITLLIVLTGVLFYLYKIGKKLLVKKVLKRLIVKAENYYKSGNGILKKNYVISEFYDRAKILSIFLSKEELDILIEIALEEIKEKLD